MAAVLRAEATDSVEPFLPRRRNRVATMSRFNRLALLAATSVLGDGGRADWPSGRRFSNTLRTPRPASHPHMLPLALGHPLSSQAARVAGPPPDRAGGVARDDDRAVVPARPPGQEVVGGRRRKDRRQHCAVVYY